MRDERTCIVCGKKYSYCPHCKSNQASEQWRYLFHDEKCMDIANTLYAYRGSEITKDEARKRMEKNSPNIDDALKYNSLTANSIKDIFGIKEEVENIEETNVQDTKPEVQEEPKVEATDVKFNKKRPIKKETHESE